MIDFHYHPNGNPLKVAIMLEEAELPHRLLRYKLDTGDHLTAEFRAINPNNKLPAIVDHKPADGGAPLPVFESGAILLYLAEKSGMLLPEDYRRRWEAHQWLAWQISGLGPYHGQAHHFVRYAPQGQDYAVKRYMQEAVRLLNVAERRLSISEFFAGEYSIADIACYPWLGEGPRMIGINMDDYPAIVAWRKKIDERPAVKRLFARPEFAPVTAFTGTRPELNKGQWSVFFGERQHSASTS